MDQNLLTWCVLAPASVAVLGSIGCWWIDRKSIPGAVADNDEKAFGQDAKQALSLSSAVLAFAWWVAICAGLYSSDSLALWPDEAWARVVWPILAAAVFVSPHFKPRVELTSTRQRVGSDTPGLWVLVGLIAVVAASLVMPTGEGWSDMVSLHQPWIAAVTSSTACNSFALYQMSQGGQMSHRGQVSQGGQMSHRGADRWLPLVMLAALASPAIICASAYGALAQTCLAAIVATSVIAAFAAAGKLLVPASLIVPCSLFAATMIAAGRFYSYAEVAPGAYGLALFTPAIIALVDRIFTDKSSAIRIAIAATTAIVIDGFIAYRFLLS